MRQTTTPRLPLGVAVAAALAAAAPGWGGADDTRLLERITITDDPDRIQDGAGSAQSLDREELDKFSYGDPHRVLRQIPGVYVGEEEGFGLFPNISMRGSRIERNNRLTVMEDGVLIAPAPYSAPAAYYFPNVGRMDRVETRKGSSAIRHGPYTVGGALNLVSTPVPTDFAAKADVLYGSRNGRRTHAWAGDSDEQWGWLLEGYSERADGFRKLDTPRRTDMNMPDSRPGYDVHNYLGKVRWNTAPETAIYQSVEFKVGFDEKTAEETYLGLTQGDFDDDPFRRYAGSQLDEINTDHQQYQVRHYIQPTPEIDVTTTAYYNEFARNWYKLHTVNDIGHSEILANPEDHQDEMAWIRGESNTGVTGDVRANNREYYSRGLQTQVGYLFETGDWQHDMEIGLRYHQDEEDRLQWEDTYAMENGEMVFQSAVQPGETTNRVTNATAWAAYVQNTMRYGNWTLVPGLRYENIEITRRDYQEDPPDRSVTEDRRRASYDVFIPGLGATYDLSPQLSVLAGVHRGFAPTGADPETGEERSTNYELGMRYSTPFFRSEVIGFFNQYDRLVGTCTAASGGGCEIGDTFDGGRVDIYGLEATALYDLGAAQGWAYSVPMSVAYTYTESEFKESFESGFAEWGNVESGDELPMIPQHQLNLAVGLAHGNWRTNLTANYVDTHRAVAGSGSIPNEEKIDSRWLLDFSGEYAVHENVRLFASVENLTDETYISAQRPSGARVGKPRTYWAGIKLGL